MNINNFLNQFESFIIPNLGYIKLPKYKITKEDIKEFHISSDISSEKFFLSLIRIGFDKKVKENIISKDKIKEYQERANYEFSIYKKLKFIDYILLIHSIIKFCQRNDILNSPSRGSCGGSLILYLIGVTQIDPIKHNLLFERFISADRTEIKVIDGEEYLASESLPDVDIDSDNTHKSKINAFLESSFTGCTCKISNLSTMQSRISIKEVGKVLGNFSEEEMKAISENIESLFGKSFSLEETYNSNEEFKNWCDKNKQVYEIAKKLEGLIRHKSVHASGILLSNGSLIDNIPTELSSNKELVASYDMHGCSLIGIKVDNLGLKNLGAIHDCLKSIGLKINDIDINDKSIYDFLNKTNNYYGIFQCEEGLGKNVLMKIKPQTVDEVSIAIAMSRPGCYKFVDQYIENKNHNVKCQYKELEDILNPTYNIIIFQEQIMRLSKVMAKFSPSEANGVRSAIGKKNVQKMLSYKDKFIKQSIENGYPEKFVTDTWQTFEDSGNYIFCSSHSCGYAHLTIISSYLKSKYMKEFYLALLKHTRDEQNPINEISKIQKEMINFNIKLLPPSLTHSEIDFSIEGNDIRFGLSSIKGISDKTIEKINNFKRKYINKFEMFEAAKQAGLGIGHLSALIQAGTLDSYGGSRTYMVYEAQLWNNLKEKEKLNAIKIAEKFNYRIVDILLAMNKELKDEKGKPLVKDSRAETIRKHMEKYKIIYNQNKNSEELANWIYEFSHLGYTYSSKLINMYQKHISSLKPINEILNEAENINCEFVGRISEKPTYGTSRTIKKSKYGKYIVSDETSSVKVLIFNNSLEQCEILNGRFPSEDDIVIVKGIKKDGDCIFANSISIQSNKIYDKLSSLKD